MKGQATMEALFSFLAMLAVVSIIVAAVSAQRAMISAKAGEMELVAAAESAARADEISLFSGMNMTFDSSKPGMGQGVARGVEQGYFHIPYDSRMIEIRGVFIYDGSEPM
jgi:hypothetical protein